MKAVGGGGGGECPGGGWVEVEGEGVCERRDFFFPAEDGIRDYDVTGVQTCAVF